MILLSSRVCTIAWAADCNRVISLEELFEMSERNSVQLRPLFSSVEEAKREADVARCGRLPDISADLSLSYIGDGFTTERSFSDYQKAPIPHLGNGLSVSVSQPVYTGGAVTGAIELAEMKTTAAGYAVESQRDQIRFKLTGFYLDIYKYDNLRHVVDKNISQAKNVLDEMRARYGSGVVLQNDITRYELLVSNLELQLVRIDNSIDILNRNLVETVGLPEGMVIVPDTTILSRILPVDGEEWWQGVALANAPSLKLARSGVEISRKSEDIVRSERRPKIGLKAGWTIDGPILVEVPPIDRNLSYWYVGVGVSYNISSLYKSNKSLSRSRVATRRACERLEAAKEDVRLGVSADYVRYLEAYEELKTRQKSVELAERNYLTISTRYSEGMALITDMLDAANSKLDAERQLVNARINIIYYYYKLLFTSGRI